MMINKFFELRVVVAAEETSWTE